MSTLTNYTHITWHFRSQHPLQHFNWYSTHIPCFSNHAWHDYS